jgi:hypothetical protein
MLPEHAELIIGKSHRIAETFKAAIASRRGEAPPLSIYRAPASKP